MQPASNSGKIEALIERLSIIFKTDASYVVKGVGWLTGSQMVITLSSFLLSIAFANLLSPETYGIYRYILSVASIIVVSNLSGMNVSLVGAIAREYGGTWREVFKRKFYWGLLGTLGGIGVSAYYFIKDAPLLGGLILIASLAAPLADTFLIYNSILQGKKDFKRQSIYIGTTQFAFSVAIFIALILKSNLYILISIYFGVLIITRFLALRGALRAYPLNEKVDEEAVRRGAHLSAASVINIIATNIDKLIVFTYIGAAELAIYTIATVPIDQIKGVFKNLYTIALPKYAESETKHIQATIRSKLLVLLIIGAIIAALYSICAPLVFTLIFPKYIKSIFLSQISSLSLLSIPAMLTNTLIHAKADARILYRYNIWTYTWQIALLLIGAVSYGLIGVALARVASNLLMTALSIHYSRKIDRI